tara:strand:- start:264 stop:449 length:186 start_codon:yes stop_codon:yes gene_type:complete
MTNDPKTKNFRVTVYQENTYFVGADNEDDAIEIVQTQELWVGNDQENHYEVNIEVEELDNS